MYYNTTNEISLNLKNNIRKAKKQNEIVLAMFQKNFNYEYTPETMEFDLKDQKLIHEKTPLTSIRRAFTDLKNEGYIVKTKNKHIGNFGRFSYRWKLK